MRRPRSCAPEAAPKFLKNRACVEKRKRGPVQAPLFIIDAPKPVTESRIGSGHPGKPIFVSGLRRSKSVARGFASPQIFGRLLKAQELDKKVTGKHGFSIGKAYKIPQEAPNFLQSLGAGGSRTGYGGNGHSDSARLPWSSGRPAAGCRRQISTFPQKAQAPRALSDWARR